MWQSLKNVYHLLVAFLANVYFGWPSKKLTVIGVTGTDGKTTTVHLIYHILKEAGKKGLPAGRQVSMISSVGAYIGDKQYETGFHVTTPSSWKLQKFLRKASYLHPRGDDGSFLVLEVTSHALDQYRVWGIDFEVGVLTNVTREHLDYHKTYENYVKTKAKLLKKARVAVINRDDESYKIISNIKYQISNIKWITYGIRNKADVTPKNFPFKTKLLGEFNRYNCLAAISATRALGINDKIIRQAILNFTLPIGRLDVAYEKDFRVIIDMAHTPNGLENVLSAVKPTVKGRLIHIFGSAGERDYEKRPEMGKISAKYADVIILTAEDPRSESVEKIISELEAGAKNSKHEARNSKQIQIYKIQNRQNAINFAVNMAKKGDLILITGKGHERSMTYGKKDYPWSEHEAVKKALQQN